MKKPKTEMGKKFDKELTKANIDINESDKLLTEKKYKLKRKIFSLDRMEALVHSDPGLSAIYNQMAEEGRDKYGYHYNETIMNIIFNDYILNSPQYLQKYKNTKPIKKKRRDKSGIEQLKKHYHYGEDDKEKNKKDMDETQEMTTFSRYGKGSGSVDHDVGELNETVKTDSIKTTGKPKKGEFAGSGFDGKSIEPKPKNEDEEIEESTATSSAGDYQYAGPGVWSKTGKPAMKKPFWHGGTVIGESNYLIDPSGFKNYFHIMNNNKKPQLNESDDFLRSKEDLTRFIKLMKERDKKPPDLATLLSMSRDEAMYHLAILVANKMLSYFSWDELPDTNSMWDYINYREGMKKDDFIESIKDAVNDRLSNSDMGIEGLDDLREESETDVDEKKLDAALEKFEKIMVSDDVSEEQKEEFFEEYEEFLDDFVEKNIKDYDKKALTEKDMTEHHLKTPKEKKKFILKNIKTIKDLANVLNDLDVETIDELYLKLEKEMGLNETETSMIDQNQTTMANKPQPVGDLGSNVEMGVRNMNEHHLEDRGDRINFIISAQKALGYSDTEDLKNTLEDTKIISDDMIKQIYLGIEKQLEKKGIDPTTLKIDETINEDHLDTREEKIDFIISSSRILMPDGIGMLDKKYLRKLLNKLDDKRINIYYNNMEKKLENKGIKPESVPLDEKAKSKAQQRFMGMVKSAQDGDIDPDDLGDSIKKAAKEMDPEDVEDYASTKHDNLPDKMDEDSINEIDALIKETEKLLDEIGYYKKRTMNEEKKTPSMVSKERLGKENQKNFKSDLQKSGTRGAIEAQKDLQHKDQQTEIDDPKKFSEDIEKEELKKTKGEALKNVGDSVREDDKIPKRNHTDEEMEEVNLTRKGMQDWQYDNKPSDRFEKRMRDGMGEELYKQRQEKMKRQAKAPTYNKDGKPVFYGNEKNQYDKNKLGETVVTGLYFDGIGKRKLIDFALNEVKESDNINDDWFKLYFDGLGNTYSNRVELNEAIVNKLNNNEFYLDENNDIFIVKKSDTLIESEKKENRMDEGHMNKMKHLFGYDPRKYTDTKNTKKHRGF